MKNLTKILLLSLLILTLAFLAVACDKGDTPGGNENPPADNPPADDPPAPTEVDYTVTVKDYQGNPMQNVVVNLLQDGVQLDMTLVNAEGEATFADKKPGNYTVTFVSPAADYYYDEQKCTFSDTITALNVTLYGRLSEQQEFYNGEHTAYMLKEGAYYAPITPGKVNYFIYIPTRTGSFKAGLISDDTSLSVGDFGSQYYLLEESAAKPVDGKINIIVQPYHLGVTAANTTHYMIGVDARKSTATHCIITMDRVGDPPFDENNTPWTTVMPGANDLVTPAFYDYLNWKRTFHYMPLGEDITVVFNEVDGYYHYGTVDGPIVMMLIDRANPYVASFVEMCDGARLGAYIYDENGNLIRKDSYNDLIHAYAAVADKYGAFPLNKQLADMIKTLGEYKKWWDLSSNRNIFEGHIIKPENGWLFACGYYTITEDAATTAATAGRITEKSPERALQVPGTTLYFSPDLTRDGTLTITGLAPDAAVHFGDQIYTPVDGTVTLDLTFGTDCIISIVAGSVTADYTLTLTLDPLPTV